MIPDLTQYGFKEMFRTEKCTEYEGHGMRITVFEYFFKQYDQTEVARQTFVVSTKQYSEFRPLTELEQWLSKNKIKIEKQ